MATLLLSAGGAALGGAFGGSFAGLTSGVVGKALGASFGALIDQRLTGVGSEPVETGQVERFRMMGASEGAPLPRVFGRVRTGGQVIWSSRFLETVNTSRMRGKGGASGSQEVRSFNYSVSLAVALCEGEVSRIGRIWADGQPLELAGVTWRLYPGSEDQLPDPLISAIEGADDAPAYRGTAYVVFENLALAPFGNRVPQFSFEVFRRPADSLPGRFGHPSQEIRGVALVPGTGEYSLATTPVYLEYGKGESVATNVNNDRGAPDLIVSLEQMRAELPQAKAISLVVSWFGDDLRCNTCSLRPNVEQKRADGKAMPWHVSGLSRQSAKQMSEIEGRPLFGGTPSDASVLQAIDNIRAADQTVMFYPFILMEILPGNRLPDPWSDKIGQPPVPWRGRITLSSAPGMAGSPDKTPTAGEEVRRFFGEAAVSDFSILDGKVVYSGPDEWSYRRFILHYAFLSSISSGIDAFCIGSEMRSLTQIRDGADTYPAVEALRTLADDVRAILGRQVKIGYASDWSEYFGHHPKNGSGDLIYHLDPLWGHENIDFVGIDNYMPISDWRDGSSHLDACAGSIYNNSYLKENVKRGEGYDWYYLDNSARDRQERTPIIDTAYQEHWVFRYKDILNWWSRPHTNRLGGVKATSGTPWVPMSKPIWFTEIGCPAVDKGANQPNVFFDPKSSESFFPYYSSGSRDDYMQSAYLRATLEFWADSANNPRSESYGGPMVDIGRIFVWAWDARPWPDFPDRLDTWVDGVNFDRGHWINTRISQPSIAEVVTECCRRAGIFDLDVEALYGSVTGYTIASLETSRQSLQPLMLTHAFDSFSRNGCLVFSNRNGAVVMQIERGSLAVVDQGPALLTTRLPSIETSERILIGFVRDDQSYNAGVAEAVAPLNVEPTTSLWSTTVVLSDVQARAIADRWLGETSVARDTCKFELPLSMLELTAGDVVSVRIADRKNMYRIDRTEDFAARSVDAVRVEPNIYNAATYTQAVRNKKVRRAHAPVYAELLDLPLLTGDEAPHAPYLAVSRTPWTGSVALYSSGQDFSFRFNTEVYRPATLGETLEPLPAADTGLWMRRSLRVRVSSGELRSVSGPEVLGGANAAALRFAGSADWEVIQFTDARLIGAGEYVIDGILRGQSGTDGIMPEVWPTGTDFVLLDAAITQIDIASSLRGVEQKYRAGTSLLPYDDPSYVQFSWIGRGVGLRPFSPAHVTVARKSIDSRIVTWVRRTRIDGDNWDGFDVPLGEDSLSFSVVVKKEEILIAEFFAKEEFVEVSESALGSFRNDENLIFEVAQLSTRFGPGPYAKAKTLRH